MDVFLLYLTGLFRPMFYIRFGGEGVFESAAIAMFALLCIAMASSAATRKQFRCSRIELAIGAFSFWCLATYVVYPKDSIFREVVKLIIPLLSYVVAKNVLRTEEQYRRLVLLMILGYVLPVAWSAFLIASGSDLALDKLMYWSKVTRWLGVYSNVHNAGHNMTFLMFLVVIYVTLAKSDRKNRTAISLPLKALFLALVSLAGYCLLMSQVRTAVAGLLVFFLVYLYSVNRRVLMVGSGVVVALTLMFLPYLTPRFFFDSYMVEKGNWDATHLASGRPIIWENNLREYLDMPIDRQIAGAGIGNKVELNAGATGDDLTDSHNDYLSVFIQTGPIGFLLFVWIQVELLRTILQLRDRERVLFVALFISVTVMNLVSNSYVARFGLAQMLYIVMAYADMTWRGRGSTTAVAGQLSH